MGMQKALWNSKQNGVPDPSVSGLKEDQKDAKILISRNQVGKNIFTA